MPEPHVVHEPQTRSLFGPGASVWYWLEPQSVRVTHVAPLKNWPDGQAVQSPAVGPLQRPRHMGSHAEQMRYEAPFPFAQAWLS